MKTIRQAPPTRRQHVSRLTPELRALQPNRNTAVVLDRDTVKTLRAYASARGWTVTTQTQPNGAIAFWRLA